MRLKNIPIIWKIQNKKCLKNKIFLPCHSSVKWSNPGDFLKAQFVIFRCQMYVKKGYIEMRKWIYLCLWKVSWVAPFYTNLINFCCRLMNTWKCQLYIIARYKASNFSKIRQDLTNLFFFSVSLWNQKHFRSGCF